MSHWSQSQYVEQPASSSRLPTTFAILSNVNEQWGALANSGLISEPQGHQINRYDKQAIEVKLQLLSEDGPAFAVAFLQVLSAVSTVHTIQYMLALIDEVLSYNESFAQLFLDRHRVTPELPLAPFFVHSQSSDPYVAFTATKLLAKFLVYADWDVEPGSILRVVKWFKDIVSSPVLPLDQLLAAFTAMQEFLRTDAHRALFVEQEGLNLVSAILADHLQDHQVLYQGLYCIWLVSYHARIAAEVIPNTTAIPTIVKILKTVATDKVIRISIAIFRNLVDKAHNNELILENGFAKILSGLLSRRWGDEDITNDLQIVDSALQKNIARQSSFDSYQQELVSGDLAWSPCHKSERFWRENVARFEDNKCRVLGLLIQVITSSHDSQSLAIALHDLGEFARFHPRGRAIVGQFPALKARIMELLDGDDTQVSSQALLCVQKIMVFNWEFLPSGSN